MTDNVAVAMKDISDMTEQERYQHYLNVCEIAGLDPRAKLLKYTMMDDGTGIGTKHLVLYVTKGGADKLRDLHDIEVEELEDKVINGAIVYKAKGKNKKGRRDIAVGSATIEGKHGKALENAFMIAQTRATRRLTIQFSGLGLLDESEVSEDKTVPLVDSSLPFSEIGQPVDVSDLPGADITVAPLKLPAISTPIPGPEASTILTLPLPAPVAEEPKRIPNPAAGLKPVAPTEMAAPDGPQTVSPEEIKTRRKRRSKAEMDAARSQEQASDPIVAPVSDPVTVEDIPTPPPAPELKKVNVIGNLPTQEQNKVFVDRLIEYADRILVEGGMVPSAGKGCRLKLRSFVKLMNAGAELSQLTVEQWQNTFRYFDESVKTHGSRKFVAFIEESNAAAEAAGPAVAA